MLSAQPEKRYVRWLLLLLLFSVVAWVYSPVARSKYASHDDYQFLFQVKSGTYRALNNVYVTQGRPVQGMVTAYLFSLAKTIDELRHVRMISVAGVFLFGSTAIWMFRRNGSNSLFSICVSLAICLSPGFVVYAGWLTAGFIPYAAALALVAGELIGIGVNQRGLRRIALLSSGVILLFAVCATYQSAAAFAILVFLSRAFLSPVISQRPARTFIIPIGVLVAVWGAYYLASRFLLRDLPGGSQADRAALSLDLTANLHFTITKILWSALVSWAQFYSKWVQFTVALLGMVTIAAAAFAKTRRNALTSFALILGGIAVNSLPFLLLKETNFSFRTQAPLHAFFILVFGIGIAKLLASSRQTFPLRPAVFLTLTVTFAWQARQHLRKDFIAPNVRELRALRKEIAKIEKPMSNAVVFLSPAPAWLNSTQIGEFGDLSSPAWWNISPMLQMLLEERFAASGSAPLPLSVLAAQASRGVLPVINGFRAMKPAGLRSIRDPYWGGLQKTPNGWTVSSWFGAFQVASDSWIYSPVLGWLQCRGAGKTDYWFLSETLGSFWTSPDIYPKIYLLKTQTWARLSLSLASPELAVLDPRSD